MKILDKMPPQFEVVVGTYEQFTLGYKIEKIVNEYKMDRTFAMHTHLASVRGLASKKNYLASAAADNTVCLYDMRNRIENGKLTHHSDTVNCISFTPDASHVITGSKDGSLAIIRCGNWQIEKHWESPHKGFSVDTLAVHPTGKLALTTGGDGVLRTWNLIKGRQAYATNLNTRWKSDAKFVSVLKWDPSGQRYAIGANKMLDVYSVATAGVEEELSFDAKIVCAEFLNDNLIAVGLTDGKLVLYDLENNLQTVEIVAHNSRLRCMARDGEYLVTASSDGEIKVWIFTRDSLSMLSKANCDARILCMTLSMPLNEAKKDQEDEEREDSEIEEVVENKIKGFVRMQRVIVEDEDEQSKTPKGKKSIKRNGDAEGEQVNKKQKVGVQKRKADNEKEQSPKKKTKVENGNQNKKRKSLDNDEREVAKKNKIEVGGNKGENISGKRKKNRNKKKILNSSVERNTDKSVDQQRKAVETIVKENKIAVDDKITGESKTSVGNKNLVKNKKKHKKNYMKQSNKKSDENMNLNKKMSLVKVEKKKKNRQIND